MLGTLALDVGEYTDLPIEFDAGLAMVSASSIAFGCLLAFGIRRAWYALEALLER